MVPLVEIQLIFAETLGLPKGQQRHRDIASGLWFRLYNPNSAVGLGRRGPTGPQGPEGPPGPVDGGGVFLMNLITRI